MELRHVSLAYEARCSSLELSLSTTFLYEITEPTLSVLDLAPINFRRTLPPHLAMRSNSELLRTL